jgi:predicted DCC family thiol-disulfide oxidoreductase YuxK
MTLDTLTNHLENTDPVKHRHESLKWSLILVAALYFTAGLNKLVRDPIAWIQPENLGRYILFTMATTDFEFPLGELFLSAPVLLSLAAIGTLVLELAPLPMVVLKQRIDYLFASILGMHVAIAFSVGPVFTDVILILCMFASWDVLHGRLQRDSELVVVYDEHCFFCARSLHLFKFLDSKGNIKFYSQYTVPEKFKEQDVDFEEAMFVFSGETSYKGYYAFQRLIGQFREFSPISVIMGLFGVRHVGERVYRYIADNRSRYFVCSVEGGPAEK